MVQSKFFSPKSYLVFKHTVTNNKIVQNTKSEPNKFSFLCTFKEPDNRNALLLTYSFFSLCCFSSLVDEGDGGGGGVGAKYTDGVRKPASLWEMGG